MLVLNLISNITYYTRAASVSRSILLFNTIASSVSPLNSSHVVKTKALYFKTTHSPHTKFLVLKSPAHLLKPYSALYLLLVEQFLTLPAVYI